MTVQLYALTCGYVTVPRRFLLAGEQGLITVPIPSYLLVHSKGRAIFDSSLHTAVQGNSTAYIGEMLAKYHTFQFQKGDEIGAQLEVAGAQPQSIDVVINSHLHFDRCGDNCQMTNADDLVQQREIDFAREVQNTRGYLVSDWDTGQRLRAVDGEHDVFGDSSVVCFPTYGHTPGHQSVRVRTERGGEFILCGDACNLRQSLENMHVPGIVADKEAARAVFRRFAELQARGSTIMFGHDPEFWKTVAQAPERLG